MKSPNSGWLTSVGAVHNHFFLARNRVSAKHPERNGTVTALTPVFMIGCGDRDHTCTWQGEPGGVWHPTLLVSQAMADLLITMPVWGVADVLHPDVTPRIPEQPR